VGRLHARAGAGEYLDAVCGGELGDEGRIRRDGLGQPQRGSRLARGGDELVESAWRHDHDDPARAGVGDRESVRDRSRQEHQRARSGLPRLVAAEPLKLAVQDEKRLVLCLVNVGRRREARRHPVVDDAQLALAMVAADLVDRQGVQEPERLPFVGGQHEAGGPGLVIGMACSWVYMPGSLRWRCTPTVHPPRSRRERGNPHCLGPGGSTGSVLLPSEGPQQRLPGDAEQFVAQESGRV